MKIKVKNILLKEDYATQQELEKLANNCLKNYISQFIDKCYYLQSQPTNVSFNVFKGLKFEYLNLNKFVSDFTLFLRFDKNLKVKGNFGGYQNKLSGEINLREDENLFWEHFIENNEDFIKNKDKNEYIKDIYFGIYSDNLFSTLIHELQHAYDFYRSDGKFNSSKSTKNYIKQTTPTGLSGLLNGDEVKHLDKQEYYKKYLKLQHEINTRFTQAMAKTSIHNFTDTRKDNKFVSLNDYINDFKGNFLGWESMTDKVQKNLIRRASQYYHSNLEKFK
jgi:hypothetical protein